MALAVGWHRGPDPGLGELAGLAALDELARPMALARDRVLEVVPPLAGLLPEGGLRQGSTVAVSGVSRVSGGPGESGEWAAGAVSLVLALLAGPSQRGSWCAVVGAPALGLVAAAELGVELTRLALIPGPGRQWAAVTAALLGAVDVVVVQPSGRATPGEARRLVARARERRAVLVVVEGLGGSASPTGSGRGGSWPDGGDLRLVVEPRGWQGLEQGHGHLQARMVEVTVSGRGLATRPARARLWLPAPWGGVAGAGVGADARAGDGAGLGAGVGASEVGLAGMRSVG